MREILELVIKVLQLEFSIIYLVTTLGFLLPQDFRPQPWLNILCESILALSLSLDCLQVLLVVCSKYRMIEYVLIFLNINFPESVLVQLAILTMSSYLAHKGWVWCCCEVLRQYYLLEQIHRVYNEVVASVLWPINYALVFLFINCSI